MLLQSVNLELIGFNNRKPWQSLINQRQQFCEKVKHKHWQGEI
jgi:hypothetical protein